MVKATASVRVRVRIRGEGDVGIPLIDEQGASVAANVQRYARCLVNKWNELAYSLVREIFRLYDCYGNL